MNLFLKKGYYAKLGDSSRLFGLFGIFALAIGQSIQFRLVQNIATTIAVVCLFVSSLIGFYQAKLIILKKFGKESKIRISSSKSWTWLLTLLGLGSFGVMVVQPLFKVGTSIAGGDISPPVGTAWIGRLFLAFSWSGNNLGGINSPEVQLPWAVLTELSHLLGGSGAVAQRIWISILVAAVWVSIGILVRSFDMSPLAAIVAAILYFLSPFLVSNIGVNTVYLAAMFLLPAMPACLVFYGTKRLSKWKLTIIFACLSPILGIASENPPLVIMIAFLVVSTPFITYIRFGKEAGRRSFEGTVVGGIALLAVSSYWIIPTWFAIHGVATQTLASLSGWKWTESRYTLSNALWLNTIWAWHFSSYFPYSQNFRHFPLNLIKLALPVLVFSGLGMRHKGDSERFQRLMMLRSLFAVSSLVVILLSTGTRGPGSFFFRILYGLPYGWLLKEPGRFLMFASLGYALLAATVIEELSCNSLRDKIVVNNSYNLVKYVQSSKLIFFFLSFLLSAAMSFPVWTGSLILGKRKNFPSEHVKFPLYWSSLFQYLNKSLVKGSLLVLPPNIFYQMPYTWYYGNNSFIVNSLKRPVLVPSTQGYSITSTNLMNDVNLEATSLMAHNWVEANRLLNAFGTPLILVRGDIKTVKGNGSIISPAAIESSLKVDPLMQLLKKSGPLSVYKQKRVTTRRNRFATINTAKPNLKILSLFSKNTWLVQHTPIPGHSSIIQMPSLSKWKVKGNFVFYNYSLYASQPYQLALPRGLINSHLLILNEKPKDNSKIKTISLKIPLGKKLLSDGNFSSGIWGPVGNCNNVNNKSPFNAVQAQILPHGGPFHTKSLNLKAYSDTACEAKMLNWHHGSFMLDLWTRSVSGAPPRMCLWEEPAGKCLPIPPLPTSSKWKHYQVSITPPASRVSSITLFLYADSYFSGQVSQDQFSGISIRKLPFSGTIDLIHKSLHSVSVAPIRLTVTKGNYSPRWIAGKNYSHVLVDGLRNGWISKSRFRATPAYSPAQQEFQDELFLTGLCLASLAVMHIIKKWNSIKE